MEEFKDPIIEAEMKEILEEKGDDNLQPANEVVVPENEENVQKSVEEDLSRSEVTPMVIDNQDELEQKPIEILENKEEETGDEELLKNPDIIIEKAAETVEEEKEKEQEKEDNVEEKPAEPAFYYWEYEIKAPVKPLSMAESSKQEFQNVQYLKGCKWAPDGSCLLTNSDDSTIRLFGFPSNVSNVQDWSTVNSETVTKDHSWSSSLKVAEGGPIYDYCWYPFASSSDPGTSCFLTTAKDAPVHLWDAYYGTLRATYRAYNCVDESISAYSVAFDPTGQKIFCGYEKSIRIFNIARPGRECTFRKLTTSPLHDLRQHGIISCIAFNPAWESVYALGSYRKTVGLYMEDGTIISMLEGHLGGITHLLFSRDGTKLYSGARSDSKLFCWDLRNLGSEYKVYDRVVKTQQRIYFDLTTNDRYLFSGGTDGVVRVWDTLEENSEPMTFQASSTCVNGVSINPFVPCVTTTSGQRTIYDIVDNSDSSDEEASCTVINKEKEAHCLELWKF